ncbi:lipoprotein LprF, partial [Mycobacterium tuberculosis KT-0056]
MNGLISQACGSHRPRRPSSLGAVAILIAATLFATVVAGCGKKPTTASSPSPGSPSPEAQQILQDSSKATKGLHSVHVVVTVNNEPPRHVRRLQFLERMGSCQVVHRGGTRR